MQLMPVLEAALFAKVPAEDLHRLLVGVSHQGSNLGPFFKWTGGRRAAFARAAATSEAGAKWGQVPRRLMAACLRNNNLTPLKVDAHCLTAQDQCCVGINAPNPM